MSGRALGLAYAKPRVHVYEYLPEWIYVPHMYSAQGGTRV